MPKNEPVLVSNSNVNNQLIEACKTCDLDKVKQLISFGADINFVHHTGSGYKGLLRLRCNVLLLTLSKRMKKINT